MIDVPSQRFVLSAVAFEPGRKVPLGTADVEIYSFAEGDSPEAAHRYVPGLVQTEDCDIDSAVRIHLR